MAANVDESHSHSRLILIQPGETNNKTLTGRTVVASINGTNRNVTLGCGDRHKLIEG
jgi:hypothetical protein